VKKLRGIGKKILIKIHEILETGELESTKKLINTAEFEVLTIFRKIHGVGGVKAR